MLCPEELITKNFISLAIFVNSFTDGIT